MGKAALRPSLAVGKLLREKRKEMKLTLRAVSDRMARQGDRIPPSTLARIEQGQLDPGVRRLHLLLRLYDVPPHLVADLVELETLSVEPVVVEGDLKEVFDAGVRHWKAGNIQQGLAHLLAVREYVTDEPAERRLRQNATMAFAAQARNLGKYRLAKQIVDDLLCEAPEPVLMPRILVLASTIWLGLGSMDMALSVVRHAETLVDPDNDQDMAWVLHQEAKLLLEADRTDEVEPVLQRALGHYRSLGDTYGEGRGLILRIGLLEKKGDPEAALHAAHDVLDLSRAHKHARLEITGRISLGNLLSRTGAFEDSCEMLEEALRHAMQIGDRYGEFLAHYYLWKSHDAAGDRHRARFELQAARYFVRFIDDHSREAEEVRGLPEESA